VTTPEIPVDPLRVIAYLKTRLTEEITNSAVLNVALQEAQERERALASALDAMRQAQAPGAADRESPQ
jgi:hypothetical protein